MERSEATPGDVVFFSYDLAIGIKSIRAIEDIFQQIVLV
jgi:hypothetical protein